MNRRSDIDRVLQVWMSDGPTAIPDRVVDVVATRIAVQRQRRTWPFPGRTNVTTPMKLIAGLAAALVVAFVGYNLLPGTSEPGGPTTAPTPSSQPTGTVTAAPSAAVVCPAWYTDGCGTGAGILTAGSHATRSVRPGFTFSVPEGWINDSDEPGVFGLFPDTPANQAEFARSGGLAYSSFMGMNQSPYFVCDAFENNLGAKAADMVATMEANDALAMTGVTEVEIGGLTGLQFDVRLAPDWTERCPGDPPEFDLADTRARGILLDVPDRGVLMIGVFSLHSADFEAFLAQIMPVIESFEFDVEG